MDDDKNHATNTNNNKEETWNYLGKRHREVVVCNTVFNFKQKEESRNFDSGKRAGAKAVTNCNRHGHIHTVKVTTNEGEGKIMLFWNEGGTLI